jgi:hypothetical protein
MELEDVQIEYSKREEEFANKCSKLSHFDDDDDATIDLVARCIIYEIVKHCIVPSGYCDNVSKGFEPFVETIGTIVHGNSCPNYKRKVNK